MVVRREERHFTSPLYAQRHAKQCSEHAEGAAGSMQVGMCHAPTGRGHGMHTHGGLDSDLTPAVLAAVDM